jgi:hypothetical protein
MKKKTAVLAIAALIVGGLAYAAQSQNNNCVEVYIDYGSLATGTKSLACVTVDQKTSALDILSQAGFTIEGTQKYGNAVVCRVNNMPDPSMESCKDMPPADAYWAVLVKEREIIPIPFDLSGEWGWAQTGVNEIYLNPGDSIGLVFADEGEVKFP